MKVAGITQKYKTYVSSSCKLFTGTEFSHILLKLVRWFSTKIHGLSYILVYFFFFLEKSWTALNNHEHFRLRFLYQTTWLFHFSNLMVNRNYLVTLLTLCDQFIYFVKRKKDVNINNKRQSLMNYCRKKLHILQPS